MPAPFITDPSRSLIHPNASSAPKQDAGAIHTIEAATQAPPGYYKSLVLDALGILTALGTGWLYYSHFASGLSLWFAVAAFFLFAAFFSLQIFLQKRTDRRALVILAEAVAFCAWFVGAIELWILASVVAAIFLFSLFGYAQGRAELDYTTEIRFFRTTQKPLGKLVTGALLAAAILYLPQVAAGNVFISESNVQPLYDWGAGIFNNFYPGIAVTGTFGQFTQSMAQAELQDNPAYMAMKPAAQASTTAETADQLARGYALNAGNGITADTPTMHVFYEIIVNGLRNLRNVFGGWFYFWWVIIAFLLLRIIGVVMVWIAQLVSLILYEALLAVGFMKTEQHPAFKEAVEY